MKSYKRIALIIGAVIALFSMVNIRTMRWEPDAPHISWRLIFAPVKSNSKHF